MRLTAQRIETFLAELARHGLVNRAARAATPHAHAKWSAMKTFYDRRNRDASFAEAWDQALAHACGEVEAELHRRAVEGWDEPVFQRGERVGTVRKYSDRLLELRAKALMPSYREHQRLDLNADVKTDARERELRDAIGKLPKDQRAELKDLLVRTGQILEPPADAA